MADVLTRIETVSNTGTTVATFGQNVGKHVINQADVGRELIVKIALTNMTDANVTAIRNAITQAGGVAGALPASTGDAFTVAAIGTADGSAFSTGVTDVLFMRVQGTGTFNTTDAAAGTGATVTVEATFAPAL
jgi:hypothetical protein